MLIPSKRGFTQTYLDSFAPVFAQNLSLAAFIYQEKIKEAPKR